MSCTTFRVMSGDVDPFGEIKLERFLGYLHEAGWLEVEKVDLGFTSLEKMGYMWVVRRFRVQNIRLPKRGETMQIRTWISSVDRLSVNREFEVYSNNNSPLAYASGQWLILNTQTRSHVNPIWTEPKFQLCPRTVFSQKLMPIPSPKFSNHSQIITTSWSDLDFNNHVNSLSYLRWFQGLLPDRILRNYWISNCEINYLRESYLHNNLEIKLTPLQPTTEKVLGSIYNCCKSEETVRVAFKLSERNENQ